MLGKKLEVDASEVARVLTPSVEAMLILDVDPSILVEIRNITGEVVAQMIDAGMNFTAPYSKNLIREVALMVGKRLASISLNSFQDALTYSSLSAGLGVRSRVSLSMAIEPLDPDISLAESPPVPDSSVEGRVEALLADIFAASKSVEDVETLEYLTAQAKTKGFIDVEIFLLEQLVTKLDGGRGSMMKLRRLVELTVEKDPQRSIEYLKQIETIHLAKGAKVGKKNLKEVRRDMVALEMRMAAAEVVEVKRPEVMAAAEAVEPRPERVVESAPENGDHVEAIAKALGELDVLPANEVAVLVGQALAENDNVALAKFREHLLAVNPRKDGFASFILANLKVVQILTRCGLYPEAIAHQERVLHLRRRFNGDGVPDRKAIISKLADLRIEAGKSRPAAVVVADKGNGSGRRPGSGQGADTAEKRRGAFDKYLELIVQAYEADNVEAWQSYARLLLEPEFEPGTIRGLKNVNIRAANFFERRGEYEQSLKHWNKILELQMEDPKNTGNGWAHEYIEMTKRNIRRVKAACPQSP